MVCQAYRENRGQGAWNGMTCEEWVQAEGQQTWPAYVRALARGRIWPGALEINQVAKILNVNIEVYIRSEITFKRVLGFGAANGEPWRLDYQDGCHYEPLLPRQPDFAGRLEARGPMRRFSRSSGRGGEGLGANSHSSARSFLPERGAKEETSVRSLLPEGGAKEEVKRVRRRKRWRW